MLHFLVAKLQLRRTHSNLLSLRILPLKLPVGYIILGLVSVILVLVLVLLGLVVKFQVAPLLLVLALVLNSLERQTFLSVAEPHLLKHVSTCLLIFLLRICPISSKRRRRVVQSKKKQGLVMIIILVFLFFNVYRFTCRKQVLIRNSIWW